METQQEKQEEKEIPSFKQESECIFGLGKCPVQERFQQYVAAQANIISRIKAPGIIGIEGDKFLGFMTQIVNQMTTSLTSLGEFCIACTKLRELGLFGEKSNGE